MADLPPLPAVGAKPWSLNPHIQAINAESSDTAFQVNGRLSSASVDSTIRTRTDQYVVPRPTTALSDHTVYLTTQLAIAKSGGYTSVKIPYLDSFGQKWQISSQIELWGGVEYWIAPVKQNNALQKGFTVPTGQNTGSIYCVDLEGTKATLQPGNTIPIGSPLLGSSGVDINGSNWKITGKYRNWRSGVNMGVENTSTDLTQRVNNVVDIEVSGNDFGLTYYRQVNSRFRVTGSYVRTLYSPDEPHLIYGTQGYSKDCVIEYAYAENSPEGFPVIVKANEGLEIGTISVVNCAGILNIVNARGKTTVGLLRGRSMSTVGVLSDGTRILQPAFVNFISQPWTYPWYPVEIGEMDLELVGGIEDSRLRVATIDGDAGVSIKKATVSYELNDVSNAQGLFTIFGSSEIGPVTVINRGTGGIRAFWYREGPYQATATHFLRSAPVLKGVAQAIRVDDNVPNVQITYEDQKVQARTFPPVSIASLGSTAIYRPTPTLFSLRGNRWYSYPPGEYSGRPTTQDRELCYPIVLPYQLKVSDVGVMVTTAAAGATVRISLRASNSDGTPGRLLYQLGSPSAAATGESSVAVSGGPIIIPPGTYHMSVIAQGGAPGLGSVSGVQLLLGTPTITQSAQGQIPYLSGVSGAPGATFTETGYSNTSGCPRVSFKVVE